MKIAYLTNQYPKISHTFIRREICALEEEGIDVLRFSVRGSPDTLVDPADLREAALTRILLKAGAGRLLKATLLTMVRSPRAFASALSLAVRVGLRSERGLLLHLVYLVEACLLLNWSREEGVQHIHVHFGTNPGTVAMLCRELGGPTYSMTVHGPEEFDKPKQIALPEKIKRASFTCGVSNYGRAQLMRQCDSPLWEKLHVVRCGVDETFLDGEITPLPSEPRLLFVGRFSEQKCPLLLLEAAARLKDEGLEFELVMVGDGELRQEAERFISANHLDSHVVLAGWASGDEVRTWLNKSRALVLPSLAEGLPVVIMEALAQGRPTISTYIAGIPELVEPSQTGWLVYSGSLDSLVDGMRAALSTSEQNMTAFGLEGRERVRNQHSARKNAMELASLFERATLESGTQQPSSPYLAEAQLAP